ncbi:MAG: hypothetical protein K2W79_00475, partial [Hydrotalea flava]|nr:hypothetical protein [Hydrotalea flava]
MSIKQITTKFLILVFVTSFITFTGCKNSGNNENMQAPGSNSVPPPPPPAVNSNASALPIFNIKNAAGNVINIKDAFKGKKVLV